MNWMNFWGSGIDIVMDLVVIELEIDSGSVLIYWCRVFWYFFC